jgi:hypothetical protein
VLCILFSSKLVMHYLYEPLAVRLNELHFGDVLV